MRKLSFVLVVSAILVLAAAAVAYANTDSGYATWSTTTAGNVDALKTPHTDWRLNTVKCAVCHAVHKAPTTGEVLLGDDVANSCVFCHINDNAGATIVYSGNTDNYDYDFENNHSAGGGAGCTGCHAVHGANTITDTVAAKILRKTPGASSWDPQSGYLYDYYNNAGDRNGIVGAFCTACHPYFVAYYEETHKGSIGDATDYKGHIMTDSVSYQGSGTAATGERVAFLPDTYCRDCHDDGNVNQGLSGGGGAGPWSDNFPHYTVGMRFMNAALDSSGTASAAATSTVQDGVCLKCHVSGWDSTLGVGRNF